MLKHVLVTSLRHLRRHKGYAAINTLGLAVGMACCLLLLLYIRDELRYDRFHERGERIYRVTAGTSGDGQPTNANGAFSFGPALAEDFPAVEASVRLRKLGWGEKRVVARGPVRFREADLFFADSTLFRIFTLPFEAGDPAAALVEPNTVVLTASTARRYFGRTDVVGESVAIDIYNDGRFVDFRVTGVLQDVPRHSHIPFSILASFTSLTDRTEGWGFDPVFTYVLLREGASAAAVEAGLPAFLERRIGPDWWYTLHLQPLVDIRLHSNLRAELTPNGDIRYVYLFAAIAALILLIACVNFTNLATAQSIRRLRELGVRKVFGAGRGQLARQLLAEAVGMSLGAAALALVLAALGLPVFNAVSGKALALAELDPARLALAAAALALVVGLLAGGYPAWVLARVRTVEVLKGATTPGRRGAAGVRRGLVVFQFAVSILLIVGALVVRGQMEHIRSVNLGFDRDHVVVLPLNEEIRTRYDAFRQAVGQEAGVEHLTMTEQVPGRAGNGSCYLIDGEETCPSRFFVHHDFLETYAIPVVAGRGVPRDRADVEGATFLVNEAFVRLRGWEKPDEALGKAVSMEWNGREWSGTIVGVVGDFQIFGLREGKGPLVLTLMPKETLNFLSVRMGAADPVATVERLRGAWEALAPGYPFEYYVLGEDFERLHQADRRLGRIFGAFSLLAVCIACLGMLGLAAFAAQRRRREIGVRKVLGASVPGLLALLSSEFALLVAWAFAVAAPLAYVGMRAWLEAFAYKAPLGPGPFLLAGGATLALALATVSVHALRAALANPAETLRYE